MTQASATERPGAGEYLEKHEQGIHVAIVSGEPLFASSDKFECGCEWPIFTEPIEQTDVNESRDTAHGMVRTEVRPTRGDSHLGNLFPDNLADRGASAIASTPPPCASSITTRWRSRDTAPILNKLKPPDESEIVTLVLILKTLYANAVLFNNPNSGQP